MRSFLLSAVMFSFLLVGCMKADSGVVLQTIAIKPDTLTITAGNNLQLVPTFTPSQFSTIPVVWSSADASIAIVTSDGTLYAIKPGIVWISIKDKNSATAGKCYVVVQ